LGPINSIIFSTIDVTVLFLSNGKGACEKTALLSTTAGEKAKSGEKKKEALCITILTKLLRINKGDPFIFCNY